MHKKTMLLASVALAVTSLSLACEGEDKRAAREALKSLRKIQAATQVGVSFRDYQPLVIEAQSKVNEASTKLPEGELKSELTAAMEAYGDAGQAWSLYAQGKVIRQRTELGSELYAKYELNLFGYPHEQEEVLSTVWSVAGGHVDKAAKLLSD